MLVLALDTSSAAVSAAVVDLTGTAATVLAEAVTTGARGHTEHLTPTLTTCLARAGIAVTDIGAVVAGTGPGPFTGLRVGLVTAAALAEGLRVPVHGVCSLDAIAPPTGDVLVATDARRHEVYWARYRDGERTDGPNVAAPADVDPGSATAIAGAGARLYADTFGLPLLDADHPRPAVLVERAAARILAGAPSEVLVPLYLRRPDAVPPRSMAR